MTGPRSSTSVPDQSKIRLRNIALAVGKFDRFDPFFAQLGLDACEQHGFHLLEMEAHRRLVDTQDELSVFDREWLGVFRDEVSSEFLPCGADLIFVEAIFGACGTQDGGDEFLRVVDTRLEIWSFIATAPFPENLFTDSTLARLPFHGEWRVLLVAVVANGFDRAAFEGFHALSGFFFVLRLFENVGISLVVGSLEVVRCGFTAQVAVDALTVDVEFAVGVF